MASLHQIILNGRLTQLNNLLNRVGSCNVNEKDSIGRTPLHLAVSSNQENYGYRVAFLLLQAHANINAKDFQQQTPVMYACLLNRMRLIFLFFQIKSLDWHQIDIHGYSIFHHAATATKLSIFKEIVQKMKSIGMSMDCKTLLGYTPLVLAIKSSRFDNAIYLLDYTSASPLTVDNEFHFTCQQWAQQVKPNTDQSFIHKDTTFLTSLEENTYTPDIILARHRSAGLPTNQTTEKSAQTWNDLIQRLDRRIVSVQSQLSIQHVKLVPWQNEKLDSTKQVLGLLNHYGSLLVHNPYQQKPTNYCDRPLKSILHSKDSKNEKYRFRKEVTFAFD